MTEQESCSISDLQQTRFQAQQAMKIEIEKMRERRQPIEIKTILHLINQKNWIFSKDEVLETIANYFGSMSIICTPNTIAELILAIGKVYMPKTIVDICCGPGNVLSYFSNLETIKGLEINSNTTQIAQFINPNADIINADTLKYDFGNVKYDLVVGNLPFGTRTNDKKSLEIELIKKGLNLLDDNGVAIFVVPEGLITNSVASEFRHELLSNFALDMVISLPAGNFPSTFLQTSILVLRNGKPNEDIYMPDFMNNPIEIVDSFKQHQGNTYIPTSKITDRLDRNHYLSLKAIEDVFKGHDLIKLSDVSEIIKGKALDTKNFATKGIYWSFNRKDKNGRNFIDIITDERCILKPDDIVVHLIGPNNKIYFYKEQETKTVITNNYAIIRPAKDNKYISTYLRTEDGKNLLLQQINRHLIGTTMPHLNISSLSNIEIPLLPLAELNQLVSKTIKLNDETRCFLLKSSECVKNKQYDSAREYIKLAFKNSDSEEIQHTNVYLENIENVEQLERKDQEKDRLHKALHDKEKEMLSFFTHTMRNALATAPESLRQAISLLGSEVYEKDTKHYQAINKIASLFSTLSLTDCLIDTFKQSISDPQEFKQSWQKDHTGEASPQWVIASALRQSLNRIIFMSDTSELRKLLGNPETALIKATRKSFIEEVLPFNLDSQGVDVFYDWTLNHISAIEVSITDFDKLNFGVNQVRFSLLFAITSELILNALKYWDGENRIHISWQLAEQDNYVFSVKNHCKANATSNLAGTHKGLAFIKRLVELLGEQAKFICKSEDQFFIAELILNKALFNEEI